MKFLCLKENLEYALALAERFTGKNLTLPILGNLLLEADDNCLSVTATNLESAIKISVSGKSYKKGKATIPAKIISSLIQSIKEEKIDLEEKQGNIFIKTNSRDIRINGTSADDFPILPKVKKTYSFSVEGFVLGRGMEKVLPAVSTSEFKAELTGVHFKAAGSKLYLVATDTFRLAEKVLELVKKNEGSSISFILPQKVSQEVPRVFGGLEEEVDIALGDNQVIFETSKIKIISRLVDGNFPEYSSIIPKEFQLNAVANRREFTDAIKSSSIFASKLQEITLKFKNKELEITSLNQEVGEYKTVIPVVAAGKETVLGFKYRYLLDGVNALDEEEMLVGLNAVDKPSLLKNKKDNTFLYVAMPIRLN